MSTTPNQEPLALAHALTIKTKQLCTGLETSDAEVLELVTPVTADLLRWWFGEDLVMSRSLNFHAGQRQAILNIHAATQGYAG